MRGLAVLALSVLPGLAGADDLLPPEAVRTATREGGAIATGRAGPDGVPRLGIAGRAVTEAWRLPGDGTTAALAADVAARLAAAGLTPLLTCADRDCGGFEFRYGLPVTPEPDMHVNLGDFRYLSAQGGETAVGVLVSRGASALHVEITRITPGPRPAVAAAAPVSEAAPDAATPIAERLLADGHVALDDLVFETGAAALAAGDPASLADLAAFLAANPDARITLVGHTDALGALAPNIALSRRRAEAVAAALVGQYGVPAGQVTAEGAGWLAPRASNATPEGRARNRRVEAVLSAGP
ncbi:MAG: OmpA family protein [Rhodobacteraceae bacterium]|jgi:OOP family OmpA-OmpF porin|nr:OmpA family protein [Paracoccaceae bacterium]